MSKKVTSEVPGGDRVSRKSSAAPKQQAPARVPNPFGDGFGGDRPTQGTPRDFTGESRPQGASPKPSNASPYLEGRPQTSQGGAAARTNATDAGKGGVGVMPPGAGAATNWEAQQGQPGAPVQRPPFRNMK